ncbi:virion structural protein [Maribacter phage Panino]
MGAATILAGVAIVGGAAKAISGASQKRNGKRAAARFKRQRLKNTQEGRRVSTLGADLAREEQARATASAVDALQSGGIRGSIGGVGDVVQANSEMERRIGVDLDRQQIDIDRAVAADEARIQAIQEGRDTQELNNIQQQVNAGNQQMWSGFGDMAAGAGGLASSGAFSGGAGSNPAPAQSVTPTSTQMNSAFGSYGSAFGSQSVINPLTGKPYGIV